MNLIKPRSLSKGDTIAVIAPSGYVDYDRIMRAKNYFENKGYKIKLGENLFKTERYLAGSDEERVSDLHKAFLDNEVNAVLCARGGYGAIRLIKLIDFDMIRNHPKIFCGYSDITVLSAMFLKRSRLLTFFSPMLQSDFSTPDPLDFTADSFFNVLSGLREEYKSSYTIRSGCAKGIIFGGNLSTLVSLCGIDFIPEKKFIFFVEDVSEPVYKLDRMFNQLINIKKFRENIQGIAFGSFTGVDNENWLSELLKETADILEVPAYGGFAFTHEKRKQTLPYGACAELNDSLVVY